MIKSHKELPHSLDAEESLLSCCFLDGSESLSIAVEAGITRDSFYDSRHGLLFSTMLDLFNHGKAIDIAVVAEELKATKQLQGVGGVPFLVQVSSRSPTTAQIRYFVSKVIEHQTRRAIIKAANQTLEDAFATDAAIGDVVDKTERRFLDISNAQSSSTILTADTVAKEAMASFKDMIANRGFKDGVKTGFVDVDKMTWGFHAGHLIILAARPSCGKTSMAMNIAENVIFSKNPVRVLVFTLEMTPVDLMQRMLTSRSRVNMNHIRGGVLKVGGDEQTRLEKATAELAASNLLIDDSPGLSVINLRARARRVHARDPIGLIIVDYLQLMAPTDKGMSREQQVAEMSRGLKMLAKELKVPVLVLSQLNRSSEKENRPPRLSDLRDSGSVEQDADMVMFLSRPSDSDDNFQVAGDVIDLKLAKNRNGQVGETKLTFLRDITRFENHHR